MTLVAVIVSTESLIYCQLSSSGVCHFKASESAELL